MSTPQRVLSNEEKFLYRQYFEDELNLAPRHIESFEKAADILISDKINDLKEQQIKPIEKDLTKIKVYFSVAGTLITILSPVISDFIIGVFR